MHNLTELQAWQSARFQYRAAFKQMAASGAPWNLYAGACNVVLLQDDPANDMPVLVRNVHAMAEQTMINALSAAMRSMK